MTVNNEDSNDSQQRKAPDARQSEAPFYKLYSKDPEIRILISVAPNAYSDT